MSAQTGTDKDLDWLETIYGASTEGEWEVAHNHMIHHYPEGAVLPVEIKDYEGNALSFGNSDDAYFLVEVRRALPNLIAELRAARAIVQEIHRIDSIFSGDDAWYFVTLEDLLREYDALRASWVTERGGDFTPTGSGSLQLKPNAYEESRALEDKLRHTQTQPETHPQSR